MTHISTKTPEQISKNMKQVKCKDSAIEWALRRELFSRGLRYRKNVASIFGKPDIVFARSKVVVFCDSEFWHGYDWNTRKNNIKTNRDFWIPKIERNIARDLEVTERLTNDGWKVIRFWGKEIKSNCSKCADQVEIAIKERQ